MFIDENWLDIMMTSYRMSRDVILKGQFFEAIYKRKYKSD